MPGAFVHSEPRSSRRPSVWLLSRRRGAARSTDYSRLRRLTIRRTLSLDEPTPNRGLMVKPNDAALVGLAEAVEAYVLSVSAPGVASSWSS